MLSIYLTIEEKVSAQFLILPTIMLSASNFLCNFTNITRKKRKITNICNKRFSRNYKAIRFLKMVIGCSVKL